MARLNLRIREARTRAKITLEAIGRACGGKSPQAVAAWEVGRSRPSAADLATIAALTGVNLHWLISGEKLGLPELDQSAGAQLGRLVPSVNWERVLSFISGQVSDTPQQFARSHFPCGPRSFRTQIVDRSNEPNYQIGDSIIIDPDATPRPGDYVMVNLPGDELALRRYRRTAQGVELIPANPDWPPYCAADLTVVMLVGVLTEHARPRSL